jgi:excisionase family DNA binding protein
MSEYKDTSLDDDLSEEELDASDKAVTAAIQMLVDEDSVFGFELSASGSENSDTGAFPGQTLSSYIRNSRTAWTAEEIADILSLTKQHIYRLAKGGRMPSYRLGGAVRFDPQTTADWLDQKVTG